MCQVDLNEEQNTELASAYLTYLAIHVKKQSCSVDWPLLFIQRGKPLYSTTFSWSWEFTSDNFLGKTPFGDDRRMPVSFATHLRQSHSSTTVSPRITQFYTNLQTSRVHNHTRYDVTNYIRSEVILKQDAHQLVGEAKRRTTKIRPKTVRGSISGRF